mmetsp:Transcript_29256/g.75043  ORF Transcript_29256/g.75043 Transcript_29256/m.75043 type:complete len:154 (+) Transcript_29256:1541-2002(+)
MVTSNLHMQALGDVLEAVIGAVFLDCSCDLKKTWKVAEPLLHPLLTPDNIPIQPIRELQELCAKMGATLSLHSTVPAAVGNGIQQWSAVQVEVCINGIHVAFGEVASNKQHARMLAAHAALVVLKESPGLLVGVACDVQDPGDGLLSLTTASS